MGDIITVNRTDGGVSYKARVRRRGEGNLTKTFRRKSDAQKWLVLTEGPLLEGKGLPRPRRNTLGEAIDRYLLEVLPLKKASTQSVQRSLIKFWKDHLGAKRLVEVDYDALADAREYLQSTPFQGEGVEEPKMRGPAAVNRYFAVLRHIFSVAIRDWRWADDNPVARMRLLKEPRGRERTVSDEELRTLMNALERHPRRDFRLIVLLSLVTGCRRGNAQSVCWEHIDFERRTVTFPDTKNNTPHTAPLTPELCEQLHIRRLEMGRDRGPVFPSIPGSRSPSVDVKQVWRKFAKDNKFPDLHFHDLRHSVATYLVRQNVPLFSIGRMLGHKSLESTKRYAHIVVSDMEPHTEMLGARLRRVK